MAATQSSLTAPGPVASSGVNAPESIEVVPTGAALGAEIRGMDLSRPCRRRRRPVCKYRTVIKGEAVIAG